MSIYSEKKLNTTFGEVCSDISWQTDGNFLAVTVIAGDLSYIAIYDMQGSLIEKISPCGVEGQVTSLAWHPRGSLAIAWGSALFTWHEGEPPVSIDSPHRSPIRILRFSEHGNRLISADMLVLVSQEARKLPPNSLVEIFLKEGGLVGWNSNSRQLLTGFHHQLTDAISHVVFIATNKQGLDLKGVAKAAVAGDEQALDLFTNLDMFGWRPKTAGRKPIVYPSEFRDGMAFFAVTTPGILLHLSENGRCQEILDLGWPCKDMLFRSDRDQLLILTENLAVIQLAVLPDGSVEETMKIKLTGEIREVVPSLTCARPGTVAINLGGRSVRLWMLDTGDNAVLSLADDAPMAEHFTAIHASASGILCGSTNAGRLVMWKAIGDDWVPSATANLSSPIRTIQWGVHFLAVCTYTGVFLLQEHPLSAAYRNQVGCVQKSGNSLSLWCGNTLVDITGEVQVRGVAVSSKYVAIFSEKSVVVYGIVDSKAVQAVGSFQCECEDIGVYDESLILLELERVTIRTMEGTVKQILFLLPTDGIPIVLSCFNQFISVVTTEGVLRIWDNSRREAKSHGQVKNLRDLIDDYGEAMSVSSNADGSRVAFIIADTTLTPTNRLYVSDTDGDLIFWLDFVTGESADGDQQDIKDCLIVSFFWDEEDPRLMMVHVKPLFSNEDSSDNQLVCLWVSPKRIITHEKINIKAQNLQLVGCCAPDIIIALPDQAVSIERRPLGDFAGVGQLDSATKASVLKFSYHLATGELDLAFQAIHSVKSQTIWENLARSCVKSKRLDVAQICMGRMGNARIARALKQASSEPELNARVAILAIHLGMVDEAKTLLKQCKRFDLLNKLHQCLGEWDEAVDVASHYDRVRLRTIQHQRARHLEHLGDIDGAVRLYEAADTHRVNVPRMLADDPVRLKTYVDKSGDPAMLKWIAQLLESQGDMEGALKYYTRAQDACAIVRVLCFLGDFGKAGEIASSSGSRAAAYHLARQFEALGRLDDALIYYSRGHAFSNAIRICKEQGSIDKIWNLALRGDPRDQIEAARVLLESGDTHRAILLFQQAGRHAEAINLAISNGDLEAIDVITRDVTSQLDPNSVISLAQLFIDSQQYSKAVDLLATAVKISEAVSLCVEHSVTLTEDLANKLNPVGEERNKLLIEIGECALLQGSYHLAAKKFTQAGDKVRAMKALLKSGDTDKIIFLAGVSRDREVYIMAANYLQALDWRNDPQLLNTIIQFYSKARAHQALASFYMACANIEVEEYDDPEKAVVALAEARRCLARLGDDPQSRKTNDLIEKRTSILHQFIKARQLFQSGDSSEATTLCRQILTLNDPDGPVQKGKILGLMLTNEKDRFVARKLFEELRGAVTDASKFVPESTLTALGFIMPLEENEATLEED